MPLLTGSFSPFRHIVAAEVTAEVTAVELRAAVTTLLIVNLSKSTPPARVCTGIILILNLNRKVSWGENLGSNLSEPVVLTTHFYDSRMHQVKPETQYSANDASIDVNKIKGGGGAVWGGDFSMIDR